MTLRPFTKGIAIGSSGGGSSSKPPISKEAKVGKGKEIEPSVEEKKKDQEAEIEMQRQINNIIRQRQNDPPSLEKGDPTNPFFYETIKDIAFNGIMHNFENVPKMSYDTESTDFNRFYFPIN
ncbi:unnamed protein product [Lactuca saligna]|uniref:Uncharacterized protein n=1 Tax=Lactuca saligna TaxID=75948 RepID=A0AA35YWZ5_LACSI|nr:unnamed protein product [Lactuca saligna]